MEETVISGHTKIEDLPGKEAGIHLVGSDVQLTHISFANNQVDILGSTDDAVYCTDCDGVVIEPGDMLTKSDDEQQQYVTDDGIDVTRIVTVDFSTYTPAAEIQEITEMGDTYTVTYELSTIDLVDKTWKDVTQTESIDIHKTSLGEKTPAEKAEEEVGEIVSREYSILEETQEFEREAVGYAED